MNSESKQYFYVIAKCGHVGKRNYIPVKFAIEAESKKDAARIIRNFPRVKHDHKDAILDVKQIDYVDYCEILKINREDPYLNCHSRYEQKRIENLKERFELDNHSIKRTYNKQERIDRVAYKSRKNRIIEREIGEQKYDYAC